MNTTESDRDWRIAERWQQLDGEFRANHLRILCVVAFFVIHLIQHYRPWGLLASPEAPNANFHLAVTLIAAGWLSMSLAVDFCLRQRLFPKFTAYLTTGADLVLLTATLCLGGGQQSPLVLGYLLILVLAALRFDLRLLRTATAAAICAYLTLMALGRWPNLLDDRQITVVPRYAQCVTLVAISISGVMLGQLVRRIREIAIYYASRQAQGRSQGQSRGQSQGMSNER